MNEEGEMRQLAISIGVILVFAVGMLLGLLAAPAWGDQKEWKAKDMNEAPPVIAAEDTVHVERVTKPGRLDIEKLRMQDAKTGVAKDVLLVGEYTITLITDIPQTVAVAVDDSTWVEQPTGKFLTRYAGRATSVRYQKDRAVVTWEHGQKEEFPDSTVWIHPHAKGGVK